MLLLSLLLLSDSTVVAERNVYNGRSSQLNVQVPRIEADVEIDGRLDEAPWNEGAVLTGFSQYAPLDGVPAADSTEVIVWYSPTAIHFGIRAFEVHGTPRATLADRDRIFSDDYVTIMLSTFDDGRQATVFSVNPLGIQADGSLVETGRTSGNGFNNATTTRESADVAPDFVFQSKGRVTETGYEVELRIPFKSLRYQPAMQQRWGIHLLRKVQHSGQEDTWAPARRANASFLTQAGKLEGLRDLRRGLVLDLNPVLTERTVGRDPGAGWRYDVNDPEVGGNVRWGVTNNLTLNGTFNPDFSQVESDAGQLAFDPRQALFFPERRPFFLDAIEQFNTPNNLIYTRRLVQPVAAVKLTGKAVGTDVALLSAVDDQLASFTGDDHPIFNIIRAQRDIGAGSRLGAAYTDRIDGDNYNRVANVDGRLVFGGVYSAQFQFASSHTRTNGVSMSAPLWEARFDRRGRTFGWRTAIRGIDEQFRTQSGFISRPGIVYAVIAPRMTIFGQPGSFFENITGEIVTDGTWQYDSFVNGNSIQDKKLHFNVNTALRGGWRVGASLLVESFGYDNDFYSARYRLEAPDGAGGVDTVAFTGFQTQRLPNLDWVFSINTPAYQTFSASAFVLWGRDENFDEWESGSIVFANFDVSWRPTPKLRIEPSYDLQLVDRYEGGGRVKTQWVGRVKTEYQISRPIFVRLIGQYQQETRDNLTDPRSGLPILIFDDGEGEFVRAERTRVGSLRGDVLFSYQPNPGTVFFLGYGSTMEENSLIRVNRLRRTEDAFFLKASYLFRM